ncbi:NAD+ synthase [Perlabentimonas gracilis]|uniref:NAD+ synthase n=1 Tax=Perlabentimonas gracilis TaxID=2715279 RepID=UPI001407532C|nr:NAD+ synthase [Perlabentimonas gracilis]NHB69717.1 NAD+ synthase [Perlabentimonas gracilis]
MKIALAQLNYTVNYFDLNVQKIIDAIDSAKNRGAELVIFSELAICGYAPQDLLTRPDFIERCGMAMDKVAEACNGVAAIVGGPSYNNNPTGKPLFNSAFFLKDGKVQSTHNKALLPTYDIFDEYRYFEPSRSFQVAELNGKRLAITVCEDVWDDQPPSSGMGRGKLYSMSPMQELTKQQPDIIINVAASPFACGNLSRRLSVFQGNVKRYGMPLITVNQVGANNDLVFDGRSLAINANGSVALKMKDFEEDIQIVDTDDLEANQTEQQIEAEDSIALIHDGLVLGIRDYFAKLGFTKTTLGLSGGIDSAVTLVLAQRALGSDNIRVLLLPSQYSSDHSIDDAKSLAENLNVQYDIVSIANTFDTLRAGMADIFRDQPENLTEENIQARIRGVMLMALSNKFGHLLLNTSNKSESAVGYGTLYGDMCGALSVLGDVYKTQVFELAHYINREGEIIPLNTIAKPPSAELRPNQKDSDSLPEYDVLDQILFQYIEEHKSQDEIIAMGFSAELVIRTLRMVNISEYKRYQTAPILRVSSKAFGSGRRMPLVAKY